mmetsp:Transcript_69695/g.110047  ORF Transcript_69695/g.110047 Transcript_69695/m.110047 type:complete len:274 (-) Transcript_69695:644-1465(-)
MLGLAILPRSGHRLVQGLDARLQTHHVLCQLGDGIFLLSHAGFQGSDLRVQGFGLLCVATELLVAVFLLGLVIFGFLLQQCHHAVDLLQDLGEVRLLAGQSQGQEVELRMAGILGFGSLHQCQGLTNLLTIAGQLQQGCAALPEEVQRLIGVQHLDGVLQGQLLGLSSRLPGFPIFGLLFTALLHLGQHLLVVFDGVTLLGELAFQIDHLHLLFSDCLHLAFKGIEEGRDLCLLGRLYLGEAFHSPLLGISLHLDLLVGVVFDARQHAHHHVW